MTSSYSSLRLIVWIICFSAHFALAVTPSQPEFQARDRWLERVFPANGKAGESTQRLEIVFQDVDDGIARGRSWRGSPFQLGDRTFSHGLAFNSVKHLKVELGKPGREFAAWIGLENNDDTQRGEAMGRGSVTFQVLVQGKVVFSSPVMRRKDGGKSISVPLSGATNFEIRVGDGGDGRGWDQALWAEALVSLEDGSEIRLQDIPSASRVTDNPFAISFNYGASNSVALLREWPMDTRQDGTMRELRFREPGAALEVRIEVTRFSDFPAIEWVAHFKNAGEKESSILENIQAFDGRIPVNSSDIPTLHYAKGGVASFDDFAPVEAAFKPGVKLRLQPGGGRSSSSILPFFNVHGGTSGVIAAVGWTGEWAANFEGAGAKTLFLRTGMERTRLSLRPGESIRTPRMLLLFYEGDPSRGQNLLRQFILTHHRPKPNGEPLVAPVTCGNWGATRAEIHLDNIDKIGQHGLPIDYYWIDAEWFGTGGWPVNVGNWRIKQELYPQGFKPLSDSLARTGRKLMLWFEPERVYKGTPWALEHKDWLIDVGSDSLLFNLGIPQARQFLTDFISDRIKEYGLGCYRQDFNFEPLDYWRKGDAPDRQGITEIRYIEGLYAFWDELLKRHPGLIIDNCASGARRLDLETIGRATPFWRTDGPRDAIAHQCHTYGLLNWLPLSATSQDRAKDDYEFRSSMCSSLCLNWWVSGDAPAERIPGDFPFEWARTTLQQYLGYRQFYYGDYYPLTSYSQSRDLWMAYQMHRDDLGAGMVVVLRRPESPYESASFKLKGISKESEYIVRDLDSGTERKYTGSRLLEVGLPVKVGAAPGSAVLTYHVAR